MLKQTGLFCALRKVALQAEHYITSDTQYIVCKQKYGFFCAQLGKVQNTAKGLNEEINYSSTSFDDRMVTIQIIIGEGVFVKKKTDIRTRQQHSVVRQTGCTLNQLGM